MRRNTINTFTLRLIGAFLAFCSLSTGAFGGDLTVSAAASLTNAFRELGPMFSASNPEIKVQLNFGASGALLQQIAKGAPADVFASADQETMDQAQRQSLIQVAGRRDFARNALVVIVPANSGQTPTALTDLAQPTYKRIAIGLPASVPVGRYTKAVLEQAGLWTAVEPKMIGAQNVRQALDYTARAEVDAAFVYATDAALMPDKVKVTMRVPTGTPVLYPIAPISGSANLDAAQKFISFILSPAAQAVLGRYGFAKLHA